MRRIQIPFRWVSQLAFGSDGSFLTVLVADEFGPGARGYSVRRIDPSTGAVSDPVHRCPANGLPATDRDGTSLAVRLDLGDHDSVAAYPLDSGFVPPYLGRVYGVAMAADGSAVAAACDFGRPASRRGGTRYGLWVLCATLYERPLPTNPSGDLAVSSAGACVAAVGTDTRRLFVAPSDGPVHERAQDDSPRLAFSPSGRFLVSAGRSVNVWGVPDGRRLAQLRGQDEDVPAVAFAPNERLLLVGRTDGPAELWDWRAERLVQRYDWDIGRIGAVAVAPDGLTAAAAGSNGRLVVWDLDGG